MQVTRYASQNPVWTMMLILGLLAGCSSGDSSDAEGDQEGELPAVVLERGVFLDSAVEGLSYRTETQSGITDSDGGFAYRAGEYVTFSIGDMVLPEIFAASVITPLEVFGTTSLSDLRVINLSRLLQSLDTDGDPSNGITIGESAAASAMPVDFASPTFDTEVTNLVANSGSVTPSLVTGEAAVQHLQSTLTANGIGTPAETCGDDHPAVGRVATLATFFHDVSGTVRIVDNCTLQVTGFNYDGGGPSVYFYGALDAAYASEDAFIIGPQLNGTVFQESSLTLKIPDGKTLDDFNGVSVWCADFDVDFGSGMFQP
ncbi:MAG: DM13 domain-containing protein [Gammaproteobacteria bacterium]|nr:DM13 domain-containing protein [Gammaproteobacteria bacterium]